MDRKALRTGVIFNGQFNLTASFTFSLKIFLYKKLRLNQYKSKLVKLPYTDFNI